jgi:putative solute:sodium symporter small subunit
MDKPLAGTPACSIGQEAATGQPSTENGPGGASLRRVRRKAHWRSTRRLTTVLLLLWLSTGFCAVFFARELSGFSIFGWPLSFYMAAQGASLVYLALIGLYAWRMRRLDRCYQHRPQAASKAGRHDSITPKGDLP